MPRNRMLTKRPYKVENEATQKNVEKVYPTVNECTTNTPVSCTEKNCNDVFSSISNLNMHLYRTHKKHVSQFDSGSISKQFHCPEIQCVYHEQMNFRSMKLLKQHYLKVHSPKTYMCEKCNAGFSTEVYKKMHTDYCGVTFVCSMCPMSYPSYESLLTHARRKKHSIEEKSYFKPQRLELKTAVTLPIAENKSTKMKVLLPKPTTNVQIIILTDNHCNASVQTESMKTKAEVKINQLNSNCVNIKKDTRHTQTSSFGKILLSAETQTIAPFSRSIEPKKIETKVQSSTQTSLAKPPSFSNDEIIPESSSNLQVTTNPSNDILYPPVADNLDSDSSDLNLQNFTSKLLNCNMETQTDFIFNESQDLLRYCDFYSNMCTQTCEDMLLDDLEFNNIETQTTDEILTSVGSQTIASHDKKPEVNDTNHVETQTEFEKILESINY